MSRPIDAKRFSKLMREMSRVPSQVATEVAKDIRKEIMKKMDAGQDPFGNSWRLKSNGRRSTLEKTGAGRASILVRAARGAGFSITVGKLYMIYHQFGGASHLRGPGGSYKHRKRNKHFGRDLDHSGGRNNPPTRQYIPTDKLPDAWGEIVLTRIVSRAQKVLDRG